MEILSAKKSLNSGIFNAFQGVGAAVKAGNSAFGNNFLDRFFKSSDPISGAEKDGDKNIEKKVIVDIAAEVGFLRSKTGEQWVDKYNFTCGCKAKDAGEYTIYELTREKEIDGRKLIQKSSYYVDDKGFLKFKFYRKTFEEYISINDAGAKPLWGYEIYPEGAKCNQGLMVIGKNKPVVDYEISAETIKKKLMYRCFYFVKDSDEIRDKFY